jgi:tRNA(Ile)-lysidine synthetase-like protein
MIRIIGKIPHNLTVACSGGIDSMAVVHFLLQGKKKVNLAYFNHDTQHSHKAQEFVENYASDNKLNLVIGRVKGCKGKRSLEEFWRDERYDFLQRISSNYTITCHHLDDCVETWLMSSFHGQSKLIPYHRGGNIYRPFLMTTKKNISFLDSGPLKSKDKFHEKSRKAQRHAAGFSGKSRFTDHNTQKID